MKYTIIADSCCDLFAAELSSEKISFCTVPLTISIGEKDFLDDESLNVENLVTAMKLSTSAPKTACPSPENYADKMKESDNIICVTLSSKLSGSYNSARLAAENVKQEYPNKNIFVLDSLSASAGMTLILNELKELIENDVLTFEEIVKKITKFRNSTKVRFILHDLGNLVKAGRMGKIVGLIVSVLKIKPVFGDDGNGEIKMYKKVLGTKKALMTLSEFPDEKVKTEGVDIPIVITHCLNEEDAGSLSNFLKIKLGLTNIKTYLMRGLSSFYANFKGIILAY